MAQTDVETRDVALEVPTSVLAVLVVGGVGLVVFLTWAVGWSEQLQLDEHAARQRFLVDFPDAGVRAVLLSDDRGAALLDLADAAPGLVVVLGDRLVTRAGVLPEVAVREDTLILDLRDPGAPPIAIRVAPGEAREAWLRLLGARDRGADATA